MINISQPYSEGVRSSLEGFVTYEGRCPSDTELESLLWEEFDILCTYVEDLVALWVAAGYPDLPTLVGASSIKDAIREVMSDLWVEELMPQAREFLEGLSK